MTATEDLMAFLSKNPYYFDLTRDKAIMKIMKELEVCGKSATQLAQDHGIEHDKLSKKLDELVGQAVLDRAQEGSHWMYFLSFKAKKFIGLYYAAKQ